jgi:hypothetical protein
MIECVGKSGGDACNNATSAAELSVVAYHAFSGGQVDRTYSCKCAHGCLQFAAIVLLDRAGTAGVAGEIISERSDRLTEHPKTL